MTKLSVVALVVTGVGTRTVLGDVGEGLGTGAPAAQASVQNTATKASFISEAREYWG